jgi:two-component system, cell cycle sensor histidine kinase and response regulator CckA
MQAETNVGERPRIAPVTELRNEAHRAGRMKVLLIEDNPGDARLIQIMLADAGNELFETLAVQRLSEGLRRLQQGDIGVVLLDLSLPDSQGLETFVQFHAQAPRTPIIVLSGIDDTTMAVQAVHEGAQDFLVKGQVDGQLLVRAMRYAIERKRLTDQCAWWRWMSAASGIQPQMDAGEHGF